MPETLAATYQILTPMFIGGADRTPLDGIRPPSFKGALRFWWRALEWGACLYAARDDVAALRLLHRREAQLFGIAANGEGTGQSRCLLRVTSDARPLSRAALPAASPGHQYLLGLGLYHFQNQYLRDALGPARVQVEARFRPGTQDSERASVARALLTLGLLGGLGSRARKGCGALAIQTLEGAPYSVPVDADALAATLRACTADRFATLPPYTAFSGHSRVDVLPSKQDDAWQLLGEIGGEMQRYRSFGQNGKVAGQAAERNFKDDHDLAHDAAVGDHIDAHPRRAVFGLPHNYYFTSLPKPNNKADINALAPQTNGGWSDIGANRRASPLFIHPHRFPDGSLAAVLAVLPAQFLPETWRIGIKGRGAIQRLPVNPDWSVVHGFMDRFPARQAVLEPQS